MRFFRYIKIEKHQRGLLFRDGEFIRVLGEGRQLISNFKGDADIEVYSIREAYLRHPLLQRVHKAGVLDGEVTWLRLQEQERALVWLDGRFDRMLGPGLHGIWNGYFEVQVDRLDVLDVFLRHRRLEVLADSNAFGDEAEVLELQDQERALVWVDGRFTRILDSGQHVLWRVFHKVRYEVVNTASGRLIHPSLDTIFNTAGTRALLDLSAVPANHVGLLFREGRFEAQLEPGSHGLWQGVGQRSVLMVDLREKTLDISGQDIMTADKVSLRLNAVVTYKVADAIRAVNSSEDFSQALYRDAQLAVRAAVGTRELDALLSDKEALTTELEEAVRQRARELGLELLDIGIRDIILPGEMRTLMNRVTEAKKAAEANLIVRREETAAMRSQANTAKILEANPTLMKLRELEALEKVSEKADLSVILGETGLQDRLMKLI